MAETDAPKPRRLNPFAFPSETNQRFVLLIAAVCLLAVNLSLPLTSMFAPGLNPEYIFRNTPPYPETGEPDYESKLLDALLVRSKQALKSLAFPGGLVITTLIFAALAYRAHPKRIRRQKDFTPLVQSTDPTLQSEIQELAVVAGISPIPSIELGKDFREQSGQAFGFHNHYILGLGRGLRLVLRQMPDRFRAVVLHEMAHIVNKDIGRTYFAQSLWAVTILLTIAPLILGVLGLTGYVQKSLGIGDLVPRDLTTIIIFIVQVVGTLAIVTLVRASLLRVREIYADWRAASWGAESALISTFGETATSDSVKARKRPWRLHPIKQERLTFLRDPSHLFAITPDLPFLVGVVLGFSFGGLVNLVLPLMLVVGGFVLALAPAQGSSFALELLVFVGMGVVVIIPLWIVGYLISETVGLQVQREAVADVVAQRKGFTRYLRLWIPATLMAMGIEIGIYLTPLSRDAPWLTAGASWSFALFTIPWLLGVIVLTWLWLFYVRFFGRRVLGFHVSGSPPKGKRRFLVLMSSILLGALYIPAFAGRLAISAFSATTISGLGESFTPEQMSALIAFNFVTLMIALILFVTIFSLTWVLVKAYQALHKPHCPSCNQITRRCAVGQTCEHCGQDLAPWLFIPAPDR